MSLAPPSHSYSGGEGNGVASDDADRISPGRAISLTRTKEAARDLPAVAISARESARSYAALTKEDAERQPEEKLAFETRLSEDIFNFLVQIGGRAHDGAAPELVAAAVRRYFPYWEKVDAALDLLQRVGVILLEDRKSR